MTGTTGTASQTAAAANSSGTPAASNNMAANPAAGSQPSSTDASANGTGSPTPVTSLSPNTTAPPINSSTTAIGGTLTVTKTIGGLPFEDKPTTLVVTKINADGTPSAPVSMPFSAGIPASTTVGDFCNASGPTQASVQVDVAGQTAALASPTVSSVSYDPTTCLLTELLTGNKGNTFTLTCPTGPVQIINHSN